MASIGLLGFAKGASKVALDRMEAREEADREIKKQEALERLRSETAKELADYNRMHNPNEAMTSVDYESGKVTTRNAKGAVIGERAITAAEKAAEEARARKATLDEERIRAEMGNARERLSLDRARLAQDESQFRRRLASDAERDRRSLDAAGGGVNSTTEVISQIQKNNAMAIESLAGPEKDPQIVGRINRQLTTIVDNARTPAEADRLFKDYLETLSRQ